MKYFDELNRFLDGTLPAEREQELFLALSSGEQLRQSLRQLTAMRSEMRANAAAQKAPKDAKAAVLAGVGVQSRGAAAKIKSGLKHVGREITVATAAAFVAIAAVTGFDFDKNTAGFATESITHKQPTLIEINIPEEAPTKKSVSEIVNHYAAKQIPATNQPAGITRAPMPQIASSQGIISKHEYKTAPAIPADKRCSREYIFSEPDVENMPGNNCSDRNLAVEFLGSDHLYFDNPTVSPLFIPGFHNKTLGITYKADEYITVGISARNENFFLEYDGTDNLGMPVHYQQQPNLLTFQGDVRFVYGNSSAVEPFTQISAGGNNYGYVGRATAGLRIDPTDKLAFILSFEYSSLWFRHQRTIHRAGKMGVNYGIQYLIF
jgi:hypothetical protein